MQVPREFGVRDADLTETVLPNDLRRAKEVEDRILAEVRRSRFTSEDAFAIKLAFEEALTNAIKHGNANDANKRIIIRHLVDDEKVILMVGDEGPGFAPSAVPDPTADENLERPNGRGIMLMQAYMTLVCFSPTGNEVWMLKRNRTPPHCA